MAPFFFLNIRNSISRYFNTVFSYFYFQIFHEKADQGIFNFVRNLSFIGVGTVLSTLFCFLFNTIAGRVLGPSEYGNFSLIQSIGMILYLPMILGFETVLVKYCAESEEKEFQIKIISTVLGVVFLFIFITVIIYGLFFNLLTSLFSISSEFLWLSICYAVLFVFYSLSVSSLRGLHLLKKYSLFQPFYGFILLSVLLVSIYFQIVSYKTMVYASYLAFGITGFIITIVFLKKYIKCTFDSHWLSDIWPYHNLAMIGGISFTLYSNIDRILINYYMDVQSVGIYSVYYYASFALVTLLSGIFITVFFPTASKAHNKKLIYTKLKKIISLFIIFGIPGSFISEYVILQIYGTEYPVIFPLMFLFSVTAILVTSYGMFAWFFNSEGVKGAKLTVSGTLLIAILNIILNIILIPPYGLYGGIGATGIAFFIGLNYNYYYGKKFFA